MHRLLIVLLLALLPVPLAAQPADDDIAPLDLASVLVRDGKFDRAARVLAEIDESDDDLDRVKFYTVRALMHFGLADCGSAVADFERAVTAGQQEVPVHLALVQCYVTLQRWAEVVRSIERADALLGHLPSVHLTRAQAEWALGRRQDALASLSDAARRVPGNTSFAKRQVGYLVEMGLYQTASGLARLALDRERAGADDYALIGNALRRARAFDDAAAVLEMGALRHPESAPIAKALAQTYVESRRPYAAAEILARLAEREPALLAEAAELFRRAGHTSRALALNARVPESSRKLKQRIGILVEMREYERVAGMRDALRRAGLMQDEDVRYALAYAYFRGGQFERAEEQLGAIKRADLFRKATELRKLMSDCAERRWACA